MPTEEPNATVALSSLCRNVERWLELQAESAAALLSAVEQEHQHLLAALDTVEKQCADTQLLVQLGAAAAAQSYAASPSTPPLSAVATAASPLSTRKIKTSFPAIETVLAARARRIPPPHDSPPLPLPSLDVESPPRPRLSPPTPLTMLTLAGGYSPAARQLRLVFVRHGLREWRATRRCTAAVTELLLSRGAAAAPALTKAAALRRLAHRSHEALAIEVNEAWALRAALRGHWRRLFAGGVRAASAHSCLRTAVEHSRPALLRRAVRGWAACSAAARACCLATAAVAVVARRGEHALALRRWKGWVLRRAAWRRRVVRRTEAAGGWAAVHLPAMKAFDARAVFVEEGASAMADAYRRRRTSAVLLCRWLSVVVRTAPAL